jgi:hypothetical protein
MCYGHTLIHTQKNRKISMTEVGRKTAADGQRWSADRILEPESSTFTRQRRNARSGGER